MTGSGFTIRKVESRRDLNTYIRFPYGHYADDPVWVPPLLIEEKKKYASRKNPMLRHCDYQLFLLWRDGRPAGRVSAFVDHMAVEHWNENVGLFGSYECIDDPDASGILLDAAKNWLIGKGMKRMRGPWSFASQEWGTLIQGYETPPMIMAPYNPSYYDAQLRAFGLRKVKDLIVYELVDRGGEAYQLPDRFLRLADWIEKKHGVTIRSLDMGRLKEDVKIILDVANEATRDNWGFVPVTEEEAEDIARSMKPIVDADIILIAEVAGRPVGYLIVFPDVNQILGSLNGRLFPFGMFKILGAKKKIREYRIWGLGVIPEYQRKAIDTLFYRRLYGILMSKQAKRIEVNYILEDNAVMNNPVIKMGMDQVKAYRVYEMPLA